ncbi:hypothetical protein V2I68_08205 [Pseudomonas viridiflava]|uniref:Uncharacterized protein n=1 Tax=Pseudomonas viridiflava TaxID=33069 RepID=A0ABU7N6T7_PSEVI|nr:hypothetical protein [Pseudomonas viridiflava]MEE4040633.1 hypothetical protein [Pseudomonas viridiflava]MEE4060951.1 hypothetical protein [Pseudomonas viridiflava]MEE4170528.1 hypothetical protein [Pseudomonas viridiflava]
MGNSLIIAQTVTYRLNQRGSSASKEAEGSKLHTCDRVFAVIDRNVEASAKTLYAKSQIGGQRKALISIAALNHLDQVIHVVTRTELDGLHRWQCFVFRGDH